MQLLELGSAQEIHLITSPAVVEEALGVLQTKFGYSPEQPTKAQARIESACYGVFTPGVKLDVVKDDPDDNKTLS